MWNEELKAYVGILSHDRVENISKMQGFVGKATWYVAKGEGKKYLDNGAFSCKEVDGSLVVTRNVLLKDAYECKHNCLMLDDDMKNIHKIEIIDGKPKKVSVDVKDVLDLCRNFLKESGLKLAGLSWTENIFWYNPLNPIRFDSEMANFFFSKPCEIFFDEEFYEKHDQDYVLQHIDRYGGAVCIQNILAVFHRKELDTTNKKYTGGDGGLVKTLETKKKAYELIKKKWGNMVKDRKDRFNNTQYSNKYNVTFNRNRGRK